MEDEYPQLLAEKEIKAKASGFDVPTSDLNPALFDWQQQLDCLSLSRGKSAIFADCGLGKGQPIGALVLSHSGWQHIGTTQVGDMLIASDGKPYPVTGVYPKGELPTFRIHFSDGVSFVVDEDHLHILRTNNDRQRKRPWRVISTRDLLTMPLRYGESGKSRNLDIPVVKPIEFTEQELPIPPYALGVLLGDGCIRSATHFTTADVEIATYMQEAIGDEFVVAKKTRREFDYTITYPSKPIVNPITSSLRDLGLFGCGSNSKFIPMQYLYASVEQRVELLRGLMDTDGYIKESSQFYTVSDKLADNMMQLIRSLGGIPTRTVKYPSYTHRGERRMGQPCHILTFSLNTFNPFRLRRKAARWNPNPRDNGRWIDHITYEGVQEVVCISVDSPDQSYVTEHHIVTHNTPMLMEYGHQINRRTNKPILIVAPLAVARQTAQDEAPKFGYEVTLCKEQADVTPGLNITNYERIHLFSPRDFAAIILDESAILKGGIDSKTYQRLVAGYRDTPYKLCCTATPAPNDMLELLAHIEFLGVMDSNAVKACFFQHDGGDTKKWTLRPYAEDAFWRFIASWSVMLRSPSDIGYDGVRFHLPELYRHNSTVTIEHQEGASEGAQLIMPGFTKPARTLTERRNARKLSLGDRVALTAEIVASEPDMQWVVWCNLNAEGEAITKAIPGAVEVAGRHDDEMKADRMLAFAHGDIRVLVTKAKIAGRGMNWQNCSHTISCGLSDSYEDLYQYERRFWRFGQKNNVHHHIVTSELDANVIKNIARKEVQHDHMMSMMIDQMHTAMIEAVHGVERRYDPYDPQLPMLLPDWLHSEVMA